MNELFLNNDRDRYYGKRHGDKVELEMQGLPKRKNGYVVEFGLGDNNRVYVLWEDTDKPVGEVAEWLTITTPVEEISEDDLAKLLVRANRLYRNGNPVMHDSVYDHLEGVLKDMNPKNSALNRQDYVEDTEGRKTRLPVILPSVIKIKTIEEYLKWLNDKNIPDNTMLVITGKYDGCSMLSDEDNHKAYTGGGHEEYGMDITEHFSHIDAVSGGSKHKFTIGEVIMKKKVFEDNKFLKDDGTPFENPRNLVSGKLADKTPVPELLKHMNFVRFIIPDDTLSKVDQIFYLNDNFNDYKIPYTTIKAGDITEEFLYQIFDEFNDEFELDGLIIEVDNAALRRKLGHERNGEPAYMRAFKGDFEEVKDTVCTGISYQTSKQGFAKPVIHIEPTRLDGATVTNIFGDNARWCMVYGVGEGSKLTVKRSGKVIPRVVGVEGVQVVTPKEFNKACDQYFNGAVNDEFIDAVRAHLGISSLDYHYNLPKGGEFNQSGVELMADDQDTQDHQRIVAFFENMKVKNVSDGIVTEFFERGYKTVKEILSLTKEDMASWDKWGNRRAEMIYDSIHSKMQNVPLERVMHSSGFFYGLGSKKLALIKHFRSKPTVEDISAVEGFSVKSADVFLSGWDKFWSWIAELPITVNMEEKKAAKVSGTKCEGWAVVFTGFRSSELEERVILEGGEMKSGVSSKATHLVMKQKGSGSNKEKKALDLGLKILTKDELEGYLGMKIGEGSINF